MTIGYPLRTTGQEGTLAWLDRVTSPQRPVCSWYTREPTKGAAAFDLGTFTAGPIFVIATNTKDWKAATTAQVVGKSECT